MTVYVHVTSAQTHDTDDASSNFYYDTRFPPVLQGCRNISINGCMGCQVDELTKCT